jgi:hypothetical protein
MVEIHSIALQVGDGSIPTLKCLTGLVRRARAISSPAFCTPLRLRGLLLLVMPGVYIAPRYILLGHVLATKRAQR